VSQVLKWLKVEAEESIGRFEVLSSDMSGISEQHASCDELHSIAKVMLCMWVFVCLAVKFVMCILVDGYCATNAVAFWCFCCSI